MVNHCHGRMTCNSISISTVFWSYLDDGRVIMEDCVCSGTPFMVGKIPSTVGLEPETARSVSQS